MKINLIFFLARFGFGGAGNSVYKLCRSLNKNKYKINIICLNKCAYESELKKEGIKIFKIKSKRLLFSMLVVKDIVDKISKGFVKTILVSNINYTNALSSIFFNKTQNLKLIKPLKDFSKEVIPKFIGKIYTHPADDLLIDIRPFRLHIAILSERDPRTPEK